MAEYLMEFAATAEVVFWPIALDFKYADIEAIEDGEIAASLINGAIVTDEQVRMARILRKKSLLMIAHGSCAHMGGVYGLANFFTREEVLDRVYRRVPTVRNPWGVIPGISRTEAGEDPPLCPISDRVRSLRQIVEVDYFIPGCPPTPELVAELLKGVMDDSLPPKGSVLGDKMALCHTCPRRDSRSETVRLERFKRLHETLWDPERCFLDQGVICLGPATRGGCGARCINGNMPCRGCFGPTDNVTDQGAKCLDLLASLIGAVDEEGVSTAVDSVPDPGGLFYRFGLASSLLKGKRVVQDR
jgi:F420-non-reducing hydrogenase small subunit